MGQPTSGSDWAPGSRVGRYTLLAKIATGGMAEIWLADQAGLQGFQKLVVIKRILESYSKNPGFVAMFLDEAKIAAQLNHPNIVQIFDLGEHGGAYYIAMEYLPGETLSAVVRYGLKKQQPLPLQLAVKLVAGAAAGLGHAHTKLGPDGKPLGIVHRDVSPQNLIVTLDGNVKVVDFGVAQAANRATQTQEGHIKGKIAYMSPEQAASAPVDARGDVFALGVILFEATTGTRFYEDRDVPATIALLCGTMPLPKAHERNPRVPESLSEIIDNALERHPSQRYPNASAFQEALEAWLHTQPENVGPQAIEAYLKGLFGDRWGKQMEFIEAARKGQLTSARVSANLSPGSQDSQISMPGNTPGVGVALVMKARPRRGLVVVAGVAAVALLGLVGAWWKLTYEPPVTPPPEEPLKPVVVVEKQRPTEVRVETEPPGASVMIDGIALGVSPLDVPGLALGEHEVLAQLDGRQSASKKVTLQGPGERVQLMLMLPELKAAIDPTKLNPPPGGTGKLRLQTTPWTEVFIGSKRLGESPLIDIPLPAGKVTLKLVNAEANVNTQVEVEIVAGKTTVKKLKF